MASRGAYGTVARCRTLHVTNLVGASSCRTPDGAARRTIAVCVCVCSGKRSSDLIIAEEGGEPEGEQSNERAQ